MAGNYAQLLDIINNPTDHSLPAWDNDNKLIEGLTIKQYLLTIIQSLTAGYQFMGVATSSTSPGTPDQNVFYIGGAGTYANFGTSITVRQGQICIFKWNGSWTNTPIEIANSGFVNVNDINGRASAYASASAGRSAVPTAYRKAGLNITYLLTTGENTSQWVQDMFIGDDVSDWGVADNWKVVGPVSVSQNTSTGHTDINIGSDSYPVASVGEIINKLDKIIGTNLINPNKIQTGKYITSEGEIGSGEQSFSVSDYIPINGNDIVMYSVTPNINAIRPWVAYDENFNVTRVGTAPTSTTALYQFDSENYPNDKYIRIGFNKTAIEGKRANYGSTLLPYTPYTDYAPITDLDERVSVLEDETQELLVEMPNKLDKIIGTNLIEPNGLKGGRYIVISTGDIGNGDASYFVSDYISVFDKDGNGRDIISNAIKANYAGSFVVYDLEKNVLRVQYGANGTNQYTYQDGDAYVRFGYDVGTSVTEPETKCLANFGETLQPYIPYTDYKPVEDLDKRVTALENEGGGTTDFTLSFVPNCLYGVFNSITNRQIVSRLYMSHLLNDVQLKNAEIYFENFIRNIPIVPTDVATKSETTKTYNITPKRKYVDKSFSTKLRITNCATSKETTPRILVIGDSVTGGYGAISNKKVSWLPNQYWAYAKMFFEMDKIDGGDNANEYNALFVGHSSGNFTINYGGVQRLIYAHAEAEGGASLEQLFASTWGGYGTANPFYDETNQIFSINAYLAKYRTMDDLGVRLVSQSTNPAGESVVGSDGVTYTIGTEITTQDKLASWDVCTPTHIVINLTHNTSLANYQTYASQVISIIQTQLSGVPIIFMTIDETGGYFPCDYPDYNPSDITIPNNTGLHTKNGQIYNYIKETLENETNGIYLLGAQFTQPTAKCYPTIDADYSENVCRDETPKFQIANPAVLGRTYHPNNLAHAAFGYSLYSIIKWIIS